MKVGILPVFDGLRRGVGKIDVVVVMRDILWEAPALFIFLTIIFDTIIRILKRKKST